MLLGRLGASYRTDDPARSLEFYRKAAEMQPNAPEYALGYGAALVQARRFPEAAHILRQVVKLFPTITLREQISRLRCTSRSVTRKPFPNTNGS